jgi:hypothetical protein
MLAKRVQWRSEIRDMQGIPYFNDFAIEYKPSLPSTHDGELGSITESDKFIFARFIGGKNIIIREHVLSGTAVCTALLVRGVHKEDTGHRRFKSQFGLTS